MLEIKKNSLILTAGIPSISVGFERLVDNRNPTSKTYVRLLGGGFMDLVNKESTPYMASTVYKVFGEGKHHFEAGLGLVLVDPFRTDSEVWLAAHAGYRRQVPGEKTFFRAGAGIPEGAFASLGFVF